MPLFSRSGGAWVETVPKIRDGGAWTDENDQWFVRDDSTWKLIYPDPADAGDLLPVESLAVTDGPDHNSVTIGWTNPTQPTLTPTHVQVRLATLGAVWTEFTYPLTSFDWGALDASTEYLAQVRLVVRTSGIITATSPIRSVGFTTTAAPVGAPAPDPGGTGGDTIFPIGIGIGGGGAGSGDPVGTSDGCWYEYKLEILSQTAFTWIATGLTGTFSGALDEFSFDASVLDPTRVYRLCVRTACDTNADTIADTFGDWECGDPFPGLGDWGAVCGGFTDSPFSALDPVADAVFQFPRFCKDPDGDKMVLTDAISGVEVAKGAAFSSFFTNADGEHGVLPLSTVGPTLFPPTMVAPIAALNTVLAIGQDCTIVARQHDLSSFALSDGRVVSTAIYSGDAVTFKLTESATGITPSVTMLMESGAVTLTGTELTPGNSTITLALRWDDDGDKDFFVNNELAATDSSGESWYTGFVASASVITAAPPLMASMQHAGWNRLLTDEEIALFTLVPLPESNFYGVATAGSPNTLIDQVAGLVQTVASTPGLTTIFNRPALDFDGIDDQVTMGVAYGSTNVIAGIAAFNLDVGAGSGAYSIIDRDNEIAGGTSRCWQLRISNNKPQFVRISGGTVFVTGPDDVTKGVDHTIGFWLDGTTLRLYLDGVQVATNTVASLTHLGPAAIGYHRFSTGTSWFPGLIGEVLLFSAGQADADTIPDSHAYITQ